MERKRAIVGLVVVFAIGAIVYIGAGGSKNDEKSVDVYISKDTIPQGEELRSGFYAKGKVEKAESWMITNLDELKGKKAIRTIQPGRLLDESDFSDEQQTVSYQSGEGEYSIRVKAENVNGGRLEPGDIVNVLYVPLPRGSSPDAPPELDGNAESRIEGVTVLSIRTQYAKDVNDGKQQDLNNVPAAVTLKLSPDQAKKLAWQQEHGTLSIFKQGKGDVQK